jgi:hypothetical protein
LFAAREAEEPMVVVPAPQAVPEAANRGYTGEDGGGEEQVCEYECGCHAPHGNGAP